MPKLSRHQLLLYPGDYAAIQRAHPETGAAIIIRTLVRAYVKNELSETPKPPTFELENPDA